MKNKNDENPVGLTVSVPLFFDEYGNVDFRTLENYLHDVCENNYISALYSMAYNTRYRMLSHDETLEVNLRISKFVKSYGKKVYVGHPYVFNEQTLRQYFDKLENQAIDGVSMLYPERYFNISSPIIKFLKMPSDYGLGTVLHEMKLVSGFNGSLIDWPIELLKEVFENVPLLAVKEDSKEDTITLEVLKLSKKHNVNCVLAGGGKRRAMKFFGSGLKTWLNGSTMFLPKLMDNVYLAFIDGQTEYIDWYLNNIEDPFFKNVVDKVGWHLAHKAALQYFGYGSRYERFPHPEMSDETYEICEKTFCAIKASISS